MLNFDNVYRWCDAYGGGLVIASSTDEAHEKLVKKYGEERTSFIIWPWTKDDHFDENSQDVLDIYG